ncbi:MAG: adenosine kinase [Prevotellaceae bacterium]|jgi:sugar/nucleoside kinase (ribokinase family)|nr:adenosine kinase [Prevotellaceae bacterium]
MKSILGIGNALVDILATLDNDKLLQQFNLPKGSMQHVDEAVSSHIWNEIRTRDVQIVAGGSTSNTLNGTAGLGMPSTFIGKTGKDELGRLFADDQQAHGLQSHLLHSPQATGHCTVFITPDAERTMATYLGAAIDLVPDDLQPDMFDGYDYFHIEGYLVQNPDLVRRAVTLAKSKGLLISLDLASYNVVEAHKTFLADIIQHYVDIVFANEAEAAVFTGHPPLSAVEKLSHHCQIAVVKIGDQGSLIQRGTEQHIVPACPARAIDATGAGDLYASGFLYAHAIGLPLAQCGVMASTVAAKVVEIIGCRIDKSTWKSLRELTIEH